MLESLIGIIALFGLALLRLLTAFAIVIVGTIGFVLMRNWETSFRLRGNAAFDTVFSFTRSVIPLFTLMGNLLAISGVSDALFSTVHRVLYRLRGGPAVATIVACGAFSAVCGSSLATAATMSKVAMPTMHKTGYAESLATGSMARGRNTWYFDPAICSHDRLWADHRGRYRQTFHCRNSAWHNRFVVLSAGSGRRCTSETLACPQRWEERPMSSGDAKGVFAVVALFAVIMIGIYGNFFTPSEAAATGALFSLGIALAHRSLTPGLLLTTCVDRAKTSAMIFALIIGAEVFSNLISYAGLLDVHLAWVRGLNAGPFVVVLAPMLIYVILGAVLESLPMILLAVPTFYPLVQSLDFGGGWLANPENVAIWFGILVVVVTEISLISPPIGLNVFVLRSVQRDVPISTMFRGVLPFWGVDLTRLAALIAFASVSLLLLS